MTPDEKIRRGRAASELLNSSSFKDVFSAYETEISEQWRSTRLDDKEQRERLYLLIQMNADYRRILESWKSEGLLEYNNLDPANIVRLA